MLVLVVSAVGGDFANAQSVSNIPEFNSLCWKKIDCLNARAKLIDSSKNYSNLVPEDQAIAAKAFVAQQAPCTGGEDNAEWGKCLPGGVASTQIAFGGKREFLNIGDFIQSNYVFLISVAGILAAIMIVIAGFQWTMSGGNAEAITSAKNRISGALIGLFIAYMSYFILNTISPNLVNFRLPQAWMTRSQAMVPKFCSAAPSSTLYHKVAEAGDQKSKPAVPAEPFKYEVTKEQIIAISSPVAQCGSRFLMENGGSSACFGEICSNGQMCINYDADGKAGDYKCLSASIIGKITYQSLATLLPTCLKEGWAPTQITDEGESELWAVCNKGNSILVAAQNVTHSFADSQFYTLAASAYSVDAAAQRCTNSGGLAGFVMSLEFNEGCDFTDEDHIIGKGGVDLGINSWEVPLVGITSNFPLGDSQAVKIDKRRASFFSLDEVKKGIVVNIEAGSVYDIDEQSDMTVYNRF